MRIGTECDRYDKRLMEQQREDYDKSLYRPGERCPKTGMTHDFETYETDDFFIPICADCDYVDADNRVWKDK